MDYHFTLIESISLLTFVGTLFLVLVYTTSGYKNKAKIALVISVITLIFFYFNYAA